MKVYVITKGEYSDYSIYGVAIDKAEAEQMREYFSDEYDEANIEEYDTDVMKCINEGQTFYCVSLDCKNDLVECEEDNNAIKFYQPGEIGHQRYKSQERYYIHLFAKDREHAIKIGADKLYQAKYEKEMFGND